MGRRREDCTKQINNVMSPKPQEFHFGSSALAVIVGEEHRLYLTQMCFLLLTTGKSCSQKASEASYLSYSHT